MNKKRWFKRIVLLSFAGFLAYDAVQGTYTGVMMHRYCAAEARYELYPNVELDDSPKGYCNTKPYPCESTVQEQVEFIPITGVMNSEQWIYIVNMREMMSPEDPTFPYQGQAGFFRRTNHYFDLQGRPLAKYVYFEPNGETFTPLGTMLYEKFAKTEGLQVSLHGCNIPKFRSAITASVFIKEF
jgi:hypothetical protein